MIEAFLPVLPLIVFVVANAVVYGLFQGFLYSWIGATTGAVLVFLLVRKLGRQRFFLFLRKHKQVKRVMVWLEEHGFGPLFLLMCFPFSPSAIINVVAGLSGVKTRDFLLAAVLGKSVMIFSITFVGDSITSFTSNPVKTIVVLIGISLFWLLGKFLEQRLAVRAERKNG
ncbi:TVP38/TMEM64 family protein [Salimicrobium sp. PL1-032A]|uniref:TVP38/TMEM64 family protein n=1 Tax=Salimicrobium sp. PL1-032A TaxID=3095364 RepID=UPI0032601F6B